MSFKDPRIDFVRVKQSLILMLFAILASGIVNGQTTPAKSGGDDSNTRPRVTDVDLTILKRAREILDSSSKWNRKDDRNCPKTATTFSLYCALEVATIGLTGKSDHRGAALQEVRFVVDEIVSGRDYSHRLMDYNNDRTTEFSDIQEVLSIAERLIALRLKTEHP